MGGNFCQINCCDPKLALSMNRCAICRTTLVWSGVDVGLMCLAFEALIGRCPAYPPPLTVASQNRHTYGARLRLKAELNSTLKEALRPISKRVSLSPEQIREHPYGGGVTCTHGVAMGECAPPWGVSPRVACGRIWIRFSFCTGQGCRRQLGREPVIQPRQCRRLRPHWARLWVVDARCKFMAGGLRDPLPCF